MQIAAGLVGFSYPLSLVNLVGQVLGVTSAGGETRTDWRRRPLSPAQLEYALDDVRYLLDLADYLGRRPRASSAATHGPRRSSRSSSHRSRAGPTRSDGGGCPGLNQLGRRGHGDGPPALDWREDEARRQNRPLRQVMRDDLLVAIAKRQPTNRRGLEALRDFNRPPS